MLLSISSTGSVAGVEALVEDVRTYEAAFIETYAWVWDEMGLPPF